MDHKLIRAIGSVTCVMLLVKVLAMIKNILQARVYGAGVDADVFTLASSYSISLFTTMSYALCIAAIPILTQKLLSNGQCLDCKHHGAFLGGHRGVVFCRCRGDH